MKNNFNTYMITMAIIILVLAIITILTGCSLLPTSNNPIQTTPVKQLTNVVYKLSWMPMLSVLGIAGGVFALMNGFKWGLSAIVACGVSLFMSLATARYSGFMAICGLVGSILIMVGSVIVKNKALIEIITGIEKAKANSEHREYIKAVVNEHIAPAQTKHTKNIVKAIKSKLGD